MGNNAPDGYLKCDGTTYNIADYPALASHFETEFGTKNHFGGDGTTTFKVPDLCGEFLRGTGTNGHSGEGSGANVGEHQAGTIHKDTSTGTGQKQIRSHNLDVQNTDTFNVSNEQGTYASASAFAYDIVQLYTSRPTNTSVLYCIKF